MLSPEIPAETDVSLRRIVWQATQKCSLHCLQCYPATGRRTRLELTTREARNMIEQLALSGVSTLVIAGGEPLLRRDLYQLIAYARTLGIGIEVMTNGMGLNEISASRLARLGVRLLQISIDGTRYTHDLIHQSPGLYQHAVAGIREAQFSGMPVRVSCVINQLNMLELRTFLEQMVAVGVTQVELMRFVSTRDDRERLMLPDAEWAKVQRHCADLQRHFRGQLDIILSLNRGVNVTGRGGQEHCLAGGELGCISAHGTVYSCAFLPKPLGNLRAARFEQIWLNSASTRQAQHTLALSGGCQGCNRGDLCGGCRILATQQRGPFPYDKLSLPDEGWPA